MHSANLQGKKESVKQNSWDTIRVWWAPILSRGKLHVEVFEDSFLGESPEGAKRLVEKVSAAVNIRFQAALTKPSVLFVDRGRGFYAPATGKITDEFRQALQEHDLTAIMGNDAHRQPGNLQEVLLHETAVSWIRSRLEKSLPNRSWLETREEYGARLKRCADVINAECEVGDLCRAFPKRVRLLKDAGGGRLGK